MDAETVREPTRPSLQIQRDGRLIIRFAEENPSWGYKRIAGELRKVGHAACPSYVRDVLQRQGLAPAPRRQGPSWKQFLKTHLEVTWATDFFTEEVWTLRGLGDW